MRDPVSIGVLIDGPVGAGLSVVLFRGGWADVDYFDGIDDGGPIAAFDITSAAAFGTQLDQWVRRAWEPRQQFPIRALSAPFMRCCSTSPVARQTRSGRVSS